MRKNRPLEDHIGYWLRLVSNNVSLSFEKALKEHNISIAEWVVLNLLNEKEKLSPAIIADHMGMTRGAISKVLDKLNCKKLTSSFESSKDRRFYEITLSSEGKNILPVLTKIANANDKKYFDSLSKLEQKTLRNILKHIVSIQNINEIPIN